MAPKRWRDEELVRMGGLTSAMLGKSLKAMTLAGEVEIHRIVEEDKSVDLLYRDTVSWASWRRKSYSYTQPMQLSHLIGIANYIEGVGDVVKKDMLVNARKGHEPGLLSARAR